MSYEFLIAKRYIWSKRRHPFVGVVSTISVLGIAVGVAALIVVLAVMNGFDEDLKTRIVGMRAHVVIEKDSPFDNFPLMIQDLEKNFQVAGAAPFIEGQAILQKGEWGSGVLVRGVDITKERKVSKFFSYLTQGDLNGQKDGAVLGAELAKRLGAGIGSEFQMFTQNSEKPIHYRVQGIFSSGLYDYDANLVFLNLENAQELFHLKGSVSGVSVYLKNTESTVLAKQAIQKSLGYPYYVRTWMDLNKTLFGALKLEKTVMFLILALIILVASLNIAGSLTILVMDKTKDIGVLKALGATPSGILKIFVIDGLLIGLAGATAGLAVGTGICMILKKYSFVELPREIYYFDKLPVQMNLADALAIFGVAVGLSLLSAFYPARMAASLDPVKALRYE